MESKSKVLLIIEDVSEAVYLSARNVANLKLINPSGLNIYDVLAADYIVSTSKALNSIQEVYSD